MNAPDRLVPETTDATSNSVQSLLEQLRSRAGARHTTGLSSDVIGDHARRDPRLTEALTTAVKTRLALPDAMSRIVKMDEPDAVHHSQIGFLNFYPQHAVNPFIPLAARGPWGPKAISFTAPCPGAGTYDRDLLARTDCKQKVLGGPRACWRKSSKRHLFFQCFVFLLPAIFCCFLIFYEVFFYQDH